MSELLQEAEAIKATVKPLSGLRRLEISTFRLSSVPDAVLRMTALQHLDLTDNDIRELPDELSRLQLTCLKWLGHKR